MQRLFFRSAVLLLFALLYGLQGYTQCLSDSAVVNKVNGIHGNSGLSNHKKLSLLQALHQKYLKCHPVRGFGYAQMAHRMGDLYGKTDDLVKAIFFTKEAVQVNTSGRKNTDPSFLANSYFNLGIFYKRLNLLKESQDYFDRCIASGSQFPDKYFIVFMAFEQKSYAWYQTGDYQKSIEIANEGIYLAGEVGNLDAKAPLLAQKAQAAAELSLFSEAESSITTAIAMLEQSGNDPVHLATSYSVYADLLGKKGNPKSAISYYQKAYDLNATNENFEQCARDLLDMGSVYADELKEYDKALECYNRGFKLAREAEDQYQMAALYSNMGVVYGYQKNYSKALSYYQKALITLPLGFKDISLNRNLNSNMLKLVSNDYFVTTMIANKANALLQRYRQSGDKTDLKLSLATYELADEALDMMRWKQHAEESKLVWRKKTRDLYEECIEVCFALKDVEKAYYFFEKSRAALLNDRLSETLAENQLSKKDRQKEKQLRINAFILGQKLLAAPQEATEYSRLKADWRAAQDQWERYIRKLEQQYPAYYQHKFDRKVFPHSSLRARLKKEQQVLVEYFTGADCIYTLVLSGSQQKLLKIRYPDYEKDTRELLNLCSNRSLLNQNYSRYALLANKLYRRLFKPLGVERGRVILSPDEQFIPFEALLTDAGNRESFLAKQYAFSYVHAMRTVMKKHQSYPTETSFLGVAPLQYGGGLSALTGSDHSLERIASGFKQALLLKGADASREAFLQQATRHQLLQIYAHADADSLAKEPVLYLADGTVKLSVIQQLKFTNTELVVLSACNTGVGRNASGEGIFSMARGFMIAGVPASVTNLWQIDDQVTYRITESFYKCLQEGMTKDVALNKAKLALLDDEDGLHVMPYFWAATIVIGDTDAIEYEAGFSLFLWITAGGILMLAGALLLKNKKS
ncbi:CHAT domain-containing protein [Pedobacter frigoris]|uniref:CHAT domain-containing protein n=1 Tax=Pedobacter frigoris TaxID=2571272 RepID=A0A4U1CPY1_9SPHI|nr:CHAT domain-containing protein [Pedobacter frigoris]TKC08855.1 CHAT domain-containing protein [Pedobacter frigoris]